MKKILILLLLLVSAPLFSGQGKGISNTADNSNSCYVAGSITNPGTGIDILIRKYDVQGNTLWTNSYSGTNVIYDDEGVGVKADNNGNVYAVGNIGTATNGYDIVLLKYNSAGLQQYAQCFPGQIFNTAGEDKAAGIAVDNAGNVFITGYSTINGFTNIFIAKCTPDGNVAWCQFVNPGNVNSQPTGITIDHSNNVCITGYTAGDIFTAKYDNNGNQLWNTVYNGPAEDKAFGIAVDEYDNVYIAGFTTNTAGNADIVVIRYSAALGNPDWNHVYDGGVGADDKAFGIAVDETDHIYITGYTSISADSRAYITCKYEPTHGNLIWSQIYSGPAGDDVAKSIGLVKTNGVTTGVVITGDSKGLDLTDDYYTIKYDSAGNFLADSRYSMTSTSNDLAQQVAVAPNGTVFVTGFSELIINSKPVTYEKTQALNWGSNSKQPVISSVPVNFALYQNYPNPFNPSTNIKFDLPSWSNVKITIYDLLGREVTKLVDQYMQAGTHEVTFSNSNLSSGIYFYELRTDGFRDIKKMSLIK